MTLRSHQRTIGASQVLVVQCRDCGKTERFEGDLLNSVRAMEESGRWLVNDDGFRCCEEHSAASKAAKAAKQEPRRPDAGGVGIAKCDG